MEGDARVMSYVSSAWYKQHLKVDWTVTLFPRDDINDVMKHEIKTKRRVPLYNQRDPTSQHNEPYIIKEWNMKTPDMF